MKRKKLRTALIIIVFSFGILSIVALNNISKVVGAGLEKKLNQFGANIILSPKSEGLNVSYGGFNLGNLSYVIKYLSEKEVVEGVKGIEFKENISTIAPKLVSSRIISGEHYPLVGVDFEEEIKIKNYWSINGRIPSKGNEILLGSAVAARLYATLGQSLQIDGETYSVAGILNVNGNDDDNVIFMDLHKLQVLENKIDKVNFVEVSALCSGCPIDDIVSQISQKLPNIDIKALQSIVKQRMSAVMFVENLALTVSLVILVTACLMIGLFMFASVNERKKEIGVLRSLGYSKFNIFSVFSFEALSVGFISGIVGFLSGYFLSLSALKFLNIENSGDLTFSPLSFVLVVLGVMLVSVIASSYPSLKAAKIQPSEVLVQL